MPEQNTVFSSEIARHEYSVWYANQQSPEVFACSYMSLADALNLGS